MESYATIELPKYKSHKSVWALKIKEVGEDTLSFDKPDYASIVVGKEYIEKHNPSVGGYYVVYPDGYKSFSPAQAFEEGYTLVAA